MVKYKIILFILMTLIGCSGSNQNNSWYENKIKQDVQGVKYLETIKTNGKFCKVYEVRIENEMPFKVISCGDIFYER